MDLPTTITTVLLYAYLVGFVLLSRQAKESAGRNIDSFAKPEGTQIWTALLFKIGFVGAAAWRLFRATFPTWVPQWPPMFDWLVWPGFVAVFVGVCVALGAQSQMAGSWRIGAVEGTLGTLVTGGFFAFSRNPVFVGQLALFAGLALVKPDIVQVILSACVWIAAVWQVRIEEPILAKSLGQGYRDYAARTPRWLGFSKE